MKDLMDWLLRLKDAGDTYYDTRRNIALGIGAAGGLGLPGWEKVLGGIAAAVGIYYAHQKDTFDATINSTYNQLLSIRQHFDSEGMLQDHPELNNIEFSLVSGGGGGDPNFREDWTLTLAVALPILAQGAPTA